MRIILTAAERAEVEAADSPYEKPSVLRELLARTLPTATGYVVGGESGEDFIEVGFILRAILAHAEVEDDNTVEVRTLDGSQPGGVRVERWPT